MPIADALGQEMGASALAARAIVANPDAARIAALHAWCSCKIVQPNNSVRREPAL
jgi:hypothetical protein